jgi:hypothetical protein
MMHADAGSLKEAANNAIQKKLQGELQPESGAMMDHQRGTFADAKMFKKS